MDANNGSQLVRANDYSAELARRIEHSEANTARTEQAVHHATERINLLAEALNQNANVQREAFERAQQYQADAFQTNTTLQQQFSAVNSHITQQGNVLQALLERVSVPTNTSLGLHENDSATSNEHVLTPEPSLPPRPLDIVTNNSDELSSNARAAVIKNTLPIGMPRCFKGSRTNDACEHWCMEMHAYLRRWEVLTGYTLTPSQAVEVVAGNLSEEAATWWSNFLFNVEQGLEGQGAAKPSNETEMYGLLRKTFDDIHGPERRREKYESLKQVTSVQAFANELKHCVLFLDPRPPSYEILRRFQQGIRSDIRTEMDKYHSHIKDLTEYINKADDIDRTFYRLKQQRPKIYSDNSSYTRTKGQGRSFAISNAMPNQKNNPNGFRDWCRSNNACYSCGSISHQRSNCPSNERRFRSTNERKASGKVWHH